MTPEEYFKKNPGKSIADYYVFKGKNPDNKSDENSGSGKNQFKAEANYDRNYNIEKNNKTAFSSDFIQKQTFISTIGIVCFFLPWLSVNFRGVEGSFSAYDMAKEELNILWLIPIGFLMNISLIILNKPEFFFLRAVSFLIPIGYFFFKFSEVYNAISKVDSTGAGRRILDSIFDLSFGFYITIVMIGAIYFIREEKVRH